MESWYCEDCVQRISREEEEEDNNINNDNEDINESSKNELEQSQLREDDGSNIINNKSDENSMVY